MKLLKYAKCILKAIASGQYRVTAEGLLIKEAIVARGIYHPFIDGVPQPPTHNLLPVEGLRKLLWDTLGDGTQSTNWYLGLYSGATNPLSTWDASNVAANSTEITSPTEGYSNPTRVEWVPDALVVGETVMRNLGSLAAFNIVCATSLNIQGAFLIDSNVKGGTAGALMSATRFTPVHTVNNGSTFELGYEVQLTDS